MRTAFVMKLLPGHAAEYKRRHDELWPELHAALKDHGVSNYSIHLYEDRLLLAYAELTSRDRWQSLAQEPIVKKWWRYMADIMETNPDSSPVSIELDEMFYMA